MTTMFVPLFHAAVIATNGYSLWYDQQYVNIPSKVKTETDKMPMKGRLMFLTIWCLTQSHVVASVTEEPTADIKTESVPSGSFSILQTVYFSISLLNDLVGSNDPNPRRPPLIRKLKDFVYSLAFPVALYVAITFWGIYNFDKELIFPEALSKVFPLWLNHTMHTTVAVFIVLELLLTKRTYPSRKVGMTVVTLFNLAYVTWMHILHDRLGAWAYPIFDVLNLPMRVAFLSVAFLLGVSFYFLGEKLNSLVSPAPKRQSAEPKKKRK